MTTRAADKETVSETRQVPYVNITGQHAGLKKQLLREFERVIDSGQFVLGEDVGIFEKRFAELCGVSYAVAVNSGTDALLLALRVLKVGEGDEVITAPNSFVSTASCIRLTGAMPVFADVGEDYNIDPSKIEAAITERTKAILPVHLTGRTADMDAILAIAKRHEILVVEDAAQAVLSEYRGRRAGSFGVLGCFSLHPLKTLNACGDGGVITTNDERLYKRLQVLRNLGLEHRDDCVVWTGNSRLDTIQAAALLVKMDYLEAWTAGRRKNAEFYRRELAGVAGVRCPEPKNHERPVYHTFVIRAERRDNLKKYLADQGIGSAVHYPVPIHMQTVAKDLCVAEGSLPEAETQSKEILSLPVYPELGKEDLAYVVFYIKKFYRSENI
ncbi:MAG: DegT/DnrJ/EryC1/StrS family aminotransferase [Candidatus Omnitrophota bacterium]|nr:DegT/DnrJ/EryC1/StrS family aminotransferase [Candidatus Omnitrophota bacterium]